MKKCWKNNQSYEYGSRIFELNEISSSIIKMNFYLLGEWNLMILGDWSSHKNDEGVILDPFKDNEFNKLSKKMWKIVQNCAKW